MSVVYLDGGRKQEFTTYGTVVNVNSEYHEFYGMATLGNPFEGYHELYALMETITHLKNMGVNPCDMTYYTDDESVAYGRFFMDKYSFAGSNRGEELRRRLKRLCDKYYVGMYDEVVRVLTEARFVKVKGHKTTVYNQRVDYLCNCSFKSRFKHYDEWVSQGFLFFDKDTSFQWYPPFSLTET